MAVPRNRLSNARKNSRRAHHAKSVKVFIDCPNCKGKKTSHRVCPHCGYYKGRSVAK
jgi:large subunit ribosomal protein L32